MYVVMVEVPYRTVYKTEFMPAEYTGERYENREEAEREERQADSEGYYSWIKEV